MKIVEPNPLEQIMYSKGLDTQKLSKKMGLKRVTLRFWMKKYDSLKMYQYYRLAENLEMSPRKLLEALGLI